MLTLLGKVNLMDINFFIYYDRTALLNVVCQSHHVIWRVAQEGVPSRTVDNEVQPLCVKKKANNLICWWYIKMNS